MVSRKCHFVSYLTVRKVNTLKGRAIRDDQHVVPSIAQDVNGDTTNQRAPETVESIGAHDDQVAVDLLSRLDNRPCRGSP